MGALEAAVPCHDRGETSEGLGNLAEIQLAQADFDQHLGCVTPGGDCRAAPEPGSGTKVSTWART